MGLGNVLDDSSEVDNEETIDTLSPIQPQPPAQLGFQIKDALVPLVNRYSF